MKKQSVFEHESYKAAMRTLLTGDGQRGQLSRAAEALRVQPSFLSRVMNTEIHLTAEHAFLLTRFWRVSQTEELYFRMLVEKARAADPSYVKSLEQRLDEMRKEHESLQNRTRKPDFERADFEALYFSTWLWSALHFMAAIPEYQSQNALAARLGLPEASIVRHLQQLESFGLVRKENGRYCFSGGQFHLPKNSPFVVSHHQNWRSRAVLDAQNFSNESLHYTSVLTLSHIDFVKLKNLLLEFVSESERIARPSEAQECVALACDLFRV